MNEQYTFSHKQNMKNTGWRFLRQIVLYMPPVIGAFVAMMLTDYNETATWIGFGNGFAIGAAGWWFMPKSKDTMIKVEDQ